MINTNLYGVPKSNGDGGGKTTVIINGTGGTVNPFEPHYLWGQYFDDTEDINGDMTVNGSINVDGNVTASSIQVNNAKVIEKLEAGQIEAADIDAANITADKAEITELSGDSLDFEFANILSAFINELESNNIITKNLTVTGAAHFFELIIDKIKASGGAHLFTPADGFKIDKFEQISNGYRLYFKSTDGDKHIYNMWKTNDQAICRNFNQATTGINYDISNKYYWCLVTNTNADDENNGNPVDINFGTQENPDIVPCHYIDISTEVYDGTVNPEIGDEIVMLGYRGNDDAQRQSAIYIAAYSSIDTDLIAPLICQYRGINDFNLNAHKYTWFAAGARNGYRANQITGNLILENGQTVNEYIDDSVEGKTVYSYSLMPLYQFVTISNNAATPETIGCKILYNENNVITSLNTIPTGYKVEVYNNVDSSAIRTFTAGNNIAFNSPLKAKDNITDISYLIIILIDPNNTTIDSKTISYVQSGAAGNDGADGGHYEFRYKNAPSKPATPTNGQNTDNTWSDTPTDPDYSNNEYTWMTQCFVSGNGTYGIWSEPIRITGADGKDGEDGQDGQDGADGKDGKNGTKIEFIYTRNNTGITPATPSTTQTEDWYGTSNGVTWTDNPQGVSETQKYEYVSTRTYENNTWGPYSTPVVWSKWGEKGQDGDGYEYIYRISNSQPSINYDAYNNKSRYDDDFVPKNWSDNPLTLDENNKLEWVATRKKENGVWGDFSTPKVWAHWSAPGTNGQDGGHYEFRYKNASSKPATPLANQDTDNTWSIVPTTPDYSNNEYTWMTQCFVSGTGSYGTWSEPIRITGADGKDGEDGVDGQDGKDGKNGTKIEFIYTRNNTGITPATPATTQTEDWHGTSNGVTWTDNPSGVSENMMYEFVSTRTCENDVWGAYSTPVIWSKWGEKGQDGDGYEYIYKRYTTQPTWGNNNNNPSYWSANTNDEYYGPSGYEWSDEPEGVTSTYLYEYCSVRKKTNGTWGKFSVPSLWAHWSPAGSNGGHYEFRYKNHTPTQANPVPDKPIIGTDGTSNGWSRNPFAPNIANNEFTFMTFSYVSGEGQYSEWSDPIRITGDNGKDGEDGNNIEFIYATSTTSTPPNITYNEYNSKVPSDPDFVPRNWTDNPTGVDETNQYEFVSVRTQVNGQWTNNFSIPAIWAKWGEKGQDGDGYEYIYILSNNTPNISYTANNGKTQNDDDFIPIGWEDEPLELSATNQIEWVSTRKKHNGVWGNFSTPKVWAHWAQPGTDGVDGADGSHYEFRFQKSANKPTKPTDGSTGTTYGWSATMPTISDNEYNNGYYIWMTQCLVGSAGAYGTWTDPIRVTGSKGKDGEDGVDGQDGADGKDGQNGTKIEFIYKRFTEEQTFNVNSDNNNPANWVAIQYDDYLGPSGYAWNDNPQGVSDTYKYEYVSIRYYKLDLNTMKWGKFSAPVIWSKWGDKGMDGDGFEYIYCLSISEPSNPTPSNYQTNTNYQNNDEYASFLNNWSDDPLELSESNPIEWVSTRKKHNGVWGSFSKPAIWAHWTPKGSDGGHYEFRYKNATSKPSTPTSGQNTDNTWSNNPTNPNYLNNEYTWMTQCFVTAANTYGTWSEPVRITGSNGKDGEDGADGQDGANGADGQNGTKIEFIYKRFESEQTFAYNNNNPSYWSANQSDDDYLGPSGYAWNDNPQGITSTYKYEYVAVRYYKLDSGTMKWSKFTTPVIWSKWGEKGQDGDGYEYIFKRFDSEQTFTSNNNNPSYWSANQSDEYLGPSGYAWNDDPQGVTSVYKYEYCAVRKKTNGTWSKYSSPALWARYADKGSDGGHYEFRYQNATSKPTKPTTGQNSSSPWTTTPSELSVSDLNSGKVTWMTQCFVENNIYGTWTDPIRITGSKGKDGEDGEDGADGQNGTKIEFIYKRFESAQTFTSNNNNPSYWSANQDDDYLGPSGYAWNDNPQGITETYKFEYVAVRYYKLDSGTMKWSKFTTPVIWSKWGEKGQDGDGYEYIYKKFDTEQTFTSNNNNPSYWPANINDEYLGPSGYTWSDDPQGVNATYKYEYCAVRKKTNGTWGKFAKPALWARYADKGSDGGHYEFRYQNATSKPTKPTTGQNASSPWTTTPSELSASDLSSGKVTWMTQCFMSGSGVYGTWTDPIRITGSKGKDGEDGEDGADGTKIEFIYRRSTDNNINSNSISYNTWNGKTRNDDDFIPQNWTDNPIGVDETNKYEYVATRAYKKNSSGVYAWTDFSAPAIWSKWGEKGQDGDGVEYIFRNGSSSIMGNPTISTWETSTSYQTDGYLPTQWTDEPEATNGTYKYCFVSIRKKHAGKWGRFSDPVIWTFYVDTNDLVGPEGPAGADYEGYHLVDNGSSLIAAINSSYNPIRRTVITINFKVVHQVGANITPVTDLSGYYARYKLNNTSSWSVLSKNNTTGIISGNNDIAWEDAHRYVTVEMYKGTSASGTFLDSFTIVSVMEPKAIFDTSYGLYSLVQGHTTEINNISNRYTTLNQTVDGISTEVAQLDTSIDNLTGTVNGMSTSISTIDQKADSITSMVSKLSGVNLIDQTAWINADETPADIDYKMYKVSIKGTKETATGSTLYYVFSSMTRLISGNTYVFSLYPSTTSSTFQIDILYSTSLIKPRECPNIVTSMTVATLDNDKYENNKRKTYKFTAPSTGYYTIKVKYNSSITFYCPQLENGDAATAFDASSMCMSSAIVQSADSISMKVSRCGIDINNYTINLNADTTNITGNLNLRRSDNGFTLYDTSNNPRINIKAQNIPTPTYGDSVFSSKGYAQSQSEIKTKVASSEVNAVTAKVSIGTYSYGNSIILTIYPEIYGIANNLWTRNNINIIKCTAKLYRNTSTSASYTSEEKTLQRTGTSGSYTYPSFTWTVNNVTAGTYYIEVTIKATDVTNGYTQYNVYNYTEYTKEVTSLTYIGLDGLLVGATNNHFAKISKDGIELRWIGTTDNVYGGTSIRIDNNGFKRTYNFDVNSGPLSWVNFDGYTKATVLTSSDFTRTSFYYGNNYITEYNYIMKADDVIIFIDESLNNFSSSSNLYIRLGDGVGGTNSSLSLVGRHICIRNFSAKTVYVCSGETSSGYCVLDRDDHDYADRWNIEHAFCTFMSIPTMIKSNYSINWCCAQRA